MSGVLAGLPLRQRITALGYADGTVAPHHVDSGIPYEVDGSVAIDTVSPIDHYSNGLGFTLTGRLACSLVGPVVRVEAGPRPFDAGNRLVLEEGANQSFNHGLGFTPSQAINSILGAGPPITGGSFSTGFSSGFEVGSP